tara:strand:+ start:3544 stop:3660 length:117 start_codon:yes stop_codon:yes gene_type:complete
VKKIKFCFKLSESLTSHANDEMANLALTLSDIYKQHND